MALDTAGNVVLILFPTCNISIKQHAVADYTQLTLGDFFYGIYLAGPWGNGTDIGELQMRTQKMNSKNALSSTNTA